MYNRYFGSAGRALPPQPPAEPPAPPEEKERSGILKGLFGGNFRLPELNPDTLLVLVLVWFLITDEDGDANISDTVLIIGALLLLGF